MGVFSSFSWAGRSWPGRIFATTAAGLRQSGPRESPMKHRACSVLSLMLLAGACSGAATHPGPGAVDEPDAANKPQPPTGNPEPTPKLDAAPKPPTDNPPPLTP